MIGSLIGGAIKRRKVVLAITFVLTLFGLGAYMTLPRESNPDITFPFVQVMVPYPGVSPEDAERLLVRPLEVELQSVEGLKEMNSRASQGMAMISMEFPVNFDKEKTLNDIRSKVDMAKGRFPPDAEEPIIEEANTSQDPVLTVVLHGKAPGLAHHITTEHRKLWHHNCKIGARKERTKGARVKRASGLVGGGLYQAYRAG